MNWSLPLTSKSTFSPSGILGGMRLGMMNGLENKETGLSYVTAEHIYHKSQIVLLVLTCALAFLRLKNTKDNIKT